MLAKTLAVITFLLDAIAEVAFKLFSMLVATVVIFVLIILACITVLVHLLG